jgi:hypothetical protein
MSVVPTGIASAEPGRPCSFVNLTPRSRTE